MLLVQMSIDQACVWWTTSTIELSLRSIVTAHIYYMCFTKMPTTKDKHLHQQSRHSSLCHSLRSGPNGWSPRLAHLPQQMKKLEDYRRLAYIYICTYIVRCLDFESILAQTSLLRGMVWNLPESFARSGRVACTWQVFAREMFKFKTIERLESRCLTLANSLYRVNRAFAVAEKNFARECSLSTTGKFFAKVSPFMDQLLQSHMQYSLVVRGQDVIVLYILLEICFRH